MSYYSDKDNPLRPFRKRRLFYRYFADISGEILDIGCSTGNFMQHAPERILGIDVDRDALFIAATHGFRCLYADLTARLPFTDQSFAAVNCDSVIEHIADPVACLREIHRVLKPGGKAVIITPDIYRVKQKFWRDYTHIRPFCKESLLRLAYDTGFQESRATHYPLNYTRALYVLIPALARQKRQPLLWWIDDIAGIVLATNIILQIQKSF